MKKSTKIIIIIILLILTLLLFIKLTGYIIRTTATSINTCTDTDEKDYYNQGEVFGTQTNMNQAEDYHEQDKCLNQDTLTEFYCENNYQKSTNFNCPKGCEDGACQGEPIEVPEKTSLLKRIIEWFKI